MPIQKFVVILQPSMESRLTCLVLSASESVIKNLISTERVTFVQCNSIDDAYVIPCDVLVVNYSEYTYLDVYRLSARRHLPIVVLYNENDKGSSLMEYLDFADYLLPNNRLYDIQTVCNMVYAKSRGEIKVLDYTLDVNRRVLYMLNGSSVKLGEKLFVVTWVFFSNVGKEIDRKDILYVGWESSDRYSGRSCDVYIAQLRGMLESDDRISIENTFGGKFTLKISQ